MQSELDRDLRDVVEVSRLRAPDMRRRPRYLRRGRVCGPLLSFPAKAGMERRDLGSPGYGSYASNDGRNPDGVARALVPSCADLVYFDREAGIAEVAGEAGIGMC